MSKSKFYPTLFQHLATDTVRNLVVSAGAGAGKTAVLTRRIIKILREEELTLNRLMVVTFTDKAAVEMKERIYTAIDREIEIHNREHFKKLRDDFLKNRISTFHAFCAGLLREYPIEARIDPYFRILDETDKIFFLRKIIDRSLNEMAEQKEHPELTVLSREWSKGAISNLVFTLIQKREDASRWLSFHSGLTWEKYRPLLEKYRLNTFREICFKLARKNVLPEILAKLKLATPSPENDESKLSLRRLALLDLLPRLHHLLPGAKDEDFKPEPVIECAEAALDECSLSGSNAGGWSRVPDNLELLRLAFMTLRNVLKATQLSNFDMNWPLEEEAFEISQTLARVVRYCLTAYQTEKEKEHYLDFQDLMLKVLDLLSTPDNAHILHELRQNYLYIMVDEFQDTNAVQWEIIRLIASDEKQNLFGDRLFIVGDEKQAIYSFRGGDVTLFQRVKRELVASNLSRGTHQHEFRLAGDPEIEKDYQPEYTAMLADDHSVKAGEIIFNDNFRSAAEPIAFFNLFFQELLGQKYYEEYEARPQKLICSGNKRKGSVELLLASSEKGKPEESDSQLEDIDLHTQEAHLIAAKIKEVLTGDDPLYDYVREQAAAKRPTIAILLNRRTKLKVYEEALRRENIDFIVVRGRGFFQRQEIVDLGNLLGFLANRTNSIYLTGFLRAPVAHVSDEGLFLLSRIEPGETLWEKLVVLVGGNGQFEVNFSSEDYAALKRAHALLDRWHLLSRRMVLVDFLHLVLDEGGFYASLSRGNRGEQAISNVEKLLDQARAVTLSEQDDFLTFTQWLNERVDFVDEEGEAEVDIVLGGTVQLMTVHQSKGLEYPMVFVPDLNAHFNFGDRETLKCDFIDHTLIFNPDQTISRESNFEIGFDLPDPEKNFESTPTLIKKIIEKRHREKTIAERKRLLYVAATRAMDHLVLVGQHEPGDASTVRELAATSFEQQTYWMAWLSKILNLSGTIQGQSGSIHLAQKDSAESLEIRYRLFDESQSVLSFEEEWRTEFGAVEDGL